MTLRCWTGTSILRLPWRYTLFCMVIDRMADVVRRDLAWTGFTRSNCFENAVNILLI